MVCKEELCSWFQNLSPHKRIDYLCGMLHICLPLELRFVGSYVEDLAKKDFVHLREHEGKANSREELSKFSEIDAKTFRTKMAIYLALLRSSNRTCSSIIYQLLENNIKQTLIVMENMDEMTVHNILLVLSMAMNHPAFSYHQKMKMYEYYTTANETARQLFNKTKVQDLRIPSLILSESCETRVCDQQVSPAVSPKVTLHPNSQHTPSDSPKVYVTQIEMKGSRQKEFDKRTPPEYQLQVTWSNGEKKEVFKTHQEIFDFQNKLKQKFPDESSIHQQTAILSDIMGLQPNRSEVTVAAYTKSLSNLPLPILQCYTVSIFFDPTLQQPVQMTDASTSPRPQNGLDLPIMQQNSNAGGDLQSLSPHSPAQLELGYNGQAHSPSCSTKTTSPLISSPSCQSPVSSVDSPSNSHPSSPSPLDGEPNSLVSHLRSLNLSMYTEVLQRFSLEQLQEMRVEMMESLGLPKEAVLLLKASLIEKIRLKRLKGPHIPNGMVDPPAALLMYPPPPHPFIPPPNLHGSLPFPHPIPQPFYQNMYGFHQYPNHLVTGLQESPTNSEYSSPSQSPHLPEVNMKQPNNVPGTDSSSEESEDKQSNQPQPNGKWKGNPASGPTTHIQQDPVREEGRRNSNSNSETPPLNCDIQPLSAKTGGHHGNSGYTSDPTYNAPRPQLVRPPYNTAMPAHTNLSIPPKYIINMPENNYKGGHMSIPQHLRDVTMTTGANLHGYSVFAPDPGHRSIFPMAGGHPQHILNRSHVNFLPKSVIQAGLLTSAQHHHHHQISSQINVSGNNNGAKMLPGTPGHVLPIPPPVSMATPQTSSSVNVNSGDMPCGHSQSQTNKDMSTNVRIPVIPNILTSTSTSVTQSVAGKSLSNSHCGQTSRSSCSSCGCTGHNSAAAAPVNYMPQMPQNVWQIPNGLVPMQAMYMPHTQYLNGTNQDQVFNHQYGMVNHANHGVGGNVPHFVYGGFNYYNNHHNPNNNTHGGNKQKMKKTYCSNCGSNKHMAIDCTEKTMEAYSGHVRYSYKNDSD